MDTFLDHLSATLCKHSGSLTYIVGDFNAKCSYWYDGQETDAPGEALQQFAGCHQIHQVITTPTFDCASGKKSLLDLVFTNRPSSV